MAFNTALDLESLVVPTKAATVYAAHEQSLFLAGGMIPMVNLPAGSTTAQIPLMASTTAEKLGDLAPTNEDFTAQTLTDTKVDIAANIYAARHVMRDLGGVNPEETGRVLGNAVAAAFDADVFAAMNGFTASTSDSDPMTVDAIIDAAAQIRGAGEMGVLYGIVSPAEAANLLKDIGTTGYAGGDFQTQALRQAALPTIAGVQLFQSSYVSGTNKGFIFGADAMRVAMFKNVDLEVARRAEAVGNDIVASLHAGVGVVDATRGVKLVNVA